jgi:hypothetical protein
MLKKINCIFRSNGIFDFSRQQFDTVRVKFDGSDKWREGHLGELNFFNDMWAIINF